MSDECRKEEVDVQVFHTPLNQHRTVTFSPHEECAYIPRDADATGIP